MLKARLKIEAVVEYEVNPEYYPKGLTPEEMLAIDINSAEEDPFTLLEGADIQVTGQYCPVGSTED